MVRELLFFDGGIHPPGVLSPREALSQYLASEGMNEARATACTWDMLTTILLLLLLGLY